MKVFLEHYDPFVVVPLTQAEALESFGIEEEYFKERCIEVPDELLERYKAACKEYFEVQSKLRMYDK